MTRLANLFATWGQAPKASYLSTVALPSLISRELTHPKFSCMSPAAWEKHGDLGLPATDMTCDSAPFDAVLEEMSESREWIIICIQSAAGSCPSGSPRKLRLPRRPGPLFSFELSMGGEREIEREIPFPTELTNAGLNKNSGIRGRMGRACWLEPLFHSCS